ncbi:MAG: hypothetical protein CM15mP22_2010 [Gammaproteobacteria bacterium]|nr:MAG: hypothetical protein CM15mP22_2010 [Gammaproteobacteria bacterium]
MDNLNPSEISQIIKDRINNLETSSQESNEGRLYFYRMVSREFMD